MKAKKYRVLAVAILISGVVVCWASGEYERETLKDIKGFQFAVENLSSDAKDAGLSKERLQTLVELKLRMAGVKVLTQKERLATAGKPYLYLNVNVIETRKGHYAVGVSLDFNQEVYLSRNTNIKCVAATWQVDSINAGGNLTEEDLKNYVEKSIEKDLDIFLNDYLAANPKEPTGTKPKPKQQASNR